MRLGSVYAPLRGGEGSEGGAGFVLGVAVGGAPWSSRGGGRSWPARTPPLTGWRAERAMGDVLAKLSSHCRKFKMSSLELC